MEGGICSLANYSVAYEDPQSNRVSDFRDFVCSLFPKAFFFDFYSKLSTYDFSTLSNFLGRAIVILNFVRRFRNFIADTVPW